MVRRRGLFLFVAFLAACAMLGAEDAPQVQVPRRRLTQSLGASVNNLGLQYTLDYSLTWPLSASKNPLLSDAHVALGVSPAATPSHVRLGAWIEVSPLSVVDLRVGVEPIYYFGTFDCLLGFSGYDAPFDGDTRHARGSEASAAFGGRIFAAPTLKMRAGHFIAAAHAEFEWWKADVAGPFFYEPARDTLLRASGDRMVQTTGLLVREQPLRAGTLTYGVIHELTYVYDAPANRSQRLGAVVARQFEGRPFGLSRPRVGLRVSYYLDDPYKKGQLSAALGIVFGLHD